MYAAASTLGLLASLALGAPTQESAATEAPFPTSTAIAEGVSPESLARLDQLVQSFVDEQEIVGAELLVIKNGHSILHEAYGLADNESGAPMEIGSVFCVRSMTKPLIGTSILMLAEDKALKLSDPVAQFVPAFDVEGKRLITIQNLLQHTSGLPMSLLLGTDLKQVEGIQAVAALGGDVELGFEPGSAFNYSDQGTDTLTAVVEVASGMTAADFVRTRVLDPLGMYESLCVFPQEHPLRERALAKHVGSPGAWTRFWGPDEPPLFPFFLGSQGLYSTLEDYARFMEFWQRKGRGREGRLLKARFARKALTPGPFPLDGPTGLPELRTEYGCLMQLWAAEGEEEGEREVVAFGHTGSDGTHAWVFPEQKAMVLYFTQSRNNITGLRVEEALGDLLLGVPYDPMQAAPPLEQYLGYYRDAEDDVYRAIVIDGEDLALEILGKAVIKLTYAGEDRWKLPDPSQVIAFERAETGEVTGYHVGDHYEYRFDPAADLPSPDEIAERVSQAHHLDLLDSLGPVRLRGSLSIAKLGREGEVSTLLAWPDRFRFDAVVGEDSESLGFDGERVWYATTAEPLSQVEGPRAQLMRHNSSLARFGDWRRWYPELRAIQRLGGPAGEEVILVRTGDTSAPARTLYVHWESGRVFREESLTFVDGLGRVGQRMDFDDYREVSGMFLPHRTEVKIAAAPLIGTIVSTIDEVELGVELLEGTFELRD